MFNATGICECYVEELNLRRDDASSVMDAALEIVVIDDAGRIWMWMWMNVHVNPKRERGKMRRKGRR